MREKTHYPYAEIRNGISGKRTRSSYKERMNNGTSSSSSDYETTTKVKKSFGKKIQCQIRYMYEDEMWIYTCTTLCCMYWYVSIYSEECFWPQYMHPKLSPFNGYRWRPLGKLSHMGLEQLWYIPTSWLPITGILGPTPAPTLEKGWNLRMCLMENAKKIATWSATHEKIWDTTPTSA